jgi:hypothetical protein
MRRILVLAVLIAALAAWPAGAAPNPSGTGQPNVECLEDGPLTPGFGTAGFEHAETVYAGSGASALHAGSAHAVSQYDVACYQQGANGH